MKAKTRRTLRAFAIELGIYALLVTGYFFLVLHLLGGWLYGLEVHHRYTYPGAAILLIIGQAAVLESVTTFFLCVIRARSEQNMILPISATNISPTYPVIVG